MQWGIDWSQPSTLRGAIWVVASALAFVFIALGDNDKATGVMSVAGTLAGGLGLAAKDSSDG